MSKADVIEFGIYLFVVLVIGVSLYTIKNWHKLFGGKELGRRGGARFVVSPYATTVYVKRFPKVFLAIGR